MMQVLQYIAQHDNELNFITAAAGGPRWLPAIPCGSASGWCGWQSLGENRLAARVYNLAGFITTASGQRMAFVQYLSGYAVEPADQRNRRIPLVRFESRLYKDIYQNN
jgi:D-alanyl-D-alanine carboxypeptidase/D-alanyl-D-alanine-endopeptidase (penicillin-binding protein 4)